jgi:uncharacterized protein involved in type VI secretion and phage assembly
MSSSLDDLAVEVLDRFRNRFYGKYRGTVTDVDASTFRIKAKVPAVLKDQQTGWCVACVPYAGDHVGFAFLPEVGSGVFIEFEGGDVSFPIWSGCYWRVEETLSDATATVKAIVTKSENKILLDDDQGSITVSDQNQNQLSLDASGVSVERGSSSLVVSDSQIDANDGALQVT